MGASISVSLDYVMEGVPVDVLKEICIQVEERRDFLHPFVVDIDDIRGPTHPPSAGTCWTETYRLKGGQIVKLRKSITEIRVTTHVPLTMSWSVELVQGPFPKVLGTHTTRVLPHPQGCVMQVSHAFVQVNFIQKMMALLCKNYVRRQLKQATDMELNLLYIAALRKVAAESPVWKEHLLNTKTATERRPTKGLPTQSTTSVTSFESGSDEDVRL